jgi:hypothetical protein
MDSHLDAGVLQNQVRQGKNVSASATLISSFALRRIAQVAAESGATFTVTDSNMLSLHDKDTIKETGKDHVTLA